MKTHDSYTLHITPLAPVHIGTGESYEPTQYVIDDEGVLHEFDTGAVMAALDERDRRQLLAIAQGRPGNVMINRMQRFFHTRREQLIPFSFNRIQVSTGFLTLHQKCVEEDQGSIPLCGKDIAECLAYNAEQVLNKLEIDRFAYHATTQKPVLFGSSLKGAVRTAVLDQLNKGQNLSTRDAELFQLENLDQVETNRRRREQRRLFPRLSGYLLDNNAGKFEGDPFRLIQISDAEWREFTNLPASKVYLAVNRKKALVKDRHGREVPAIGENLYRFLECVSPWQPRAFRATLNLQRVEAAGRHPGLPVKRFSMAQIAAACNTFYWPRLTAETKLMETRGYVADAWLDAIRRLIALARPRIEAGEAFLLRVGRHSGAESVTLNGARRIRIKGKGREFTVEEAAKTLWLAANDKDQRTGLLPFGWVLVEVTDGATDTPAWPLLDELCAPWQEEAHRFARRERIRRAAQAETLARREAEATEARDAAETERLANLTPNQKRMQKLLEERSRNNQGQGPGNQLCVDLRKLLQEAAGWDMSERSAIQAGVVAILEHLDIPNATAAAARLASLSPNQLNVENLLAKQSPANRRQGPGSQLYGELRSLLQEAAGWDLADRQAAHAAAVILFEHLGMAKDNKHRKALLRGLDLA